jgi:hypothetical protein
MSGAIPPLYLHVFMALTGKILRLPLSVYVFIRDVLNDTLMGLLSVEW